MRTILPTFCLAGLFAASALTAAPQYERYLPADTMFVCSVGDVTQLNEKVSRSVLRKFSEDKVLAEFFKPMFDKLLQEMEDDKDNLITEDVLKEQFIGQIVFGADVGNLLYAVRSGDPSDSIQPSVSFLAGLKNADDFVKLLVKQFKLRTSDKDGPSIELSEEKFMGVTIYHVTITEKSDTASTSPWATPGTYASADKAPAYSRQQYSYDDEDYADYEDYEDYEDEPAKPSVTHIYFANVKNTYLTSNNQDTAHKLVEALKGEKVKTLANNTCWADVKSLADEMDVYAYVDTKPLVELINGALRKSIPPADPSQPMQPNAEAIITAIGIDSIKSLSFGLEFKPDYVRSRTVLKVDSSYGIGRLLSSVGGAYPRPDFVPEGVTSVNTSSINLGKVVGEIRQIAFNAYPAANFLYQMYTAGIQQQGVNLDTDLIGNFDDGFVMMGLDKDVPTDGIAKNLFAFKVKDAAALKRAIDAILMATQMNPRVKRSDYMGTEIISFPGATPAQTSMSMAAKDGWLMISPHSGTLQNALSANDSGKSYWKSATSKKVEKVLKGGEGYGYGYSDFDAFMKIFFKSFAQGFNSSLSQSGVSEGLMDANVIDRLDKLNLIMCSKAYKSADGFVSETYLSNE